MNSTLVTAPTIELVSLATAKDYLRVTHVFEDDVILRLLKSVIRRCETRCRMTFARQTWDTTFDVPRARRNCLLPGQATLSDSDGVYRSLVLPKRPINAVETITSLSTVDGSTETFDASYYTFLGGKLFWKSNFWSDVGNANHLTVRYTTGVTNELEFRNKFPDLVEAILLTLDHAYNRGEGPFPPTAHEILMSYWTSPTYYNE